MDDADLTKVRAAIVSRYRGSLPEKELSSLSAIFEAFFSCDLERIEQEVRSYAETPENGIHALGIFAHIVGRLTNDHGSDYSCRRGELSLHFGKEQARNYDRYRGGDAGGRYTLTVRTDGTASTAWYDDYGDRARSSSNRRSYAPPAGATLYDLARTAVHALRADDDLDRICFPYDHPAMERIKLALIRERLALGAPVSSKRSLLDRLMFWKS